MSAAEIERFLITKFRKDVWCPFVKSVKKYELVREGDEIAVCISGGKDSFLLAKCMQELCRHGQFRFGLKFIVMDPGYAPANRALIEENAEKLGVPVEIFESDIFGVVGAAQSGSPCYLCARMRRGYLYEFAKKRGCNKIALGHHFDDAVETTLLSMFYGAELKTMMPKLKSTSHAGMELIRPLYAVRESRIKGWAEYHGLTFLNCACRFTERVQNKEEESKRLERELQGVEPLYSEEDFYYFDRYLDGDDYASPEYRKNFRTALSALRGGKPLFVAYAGKRRDIAGCVTHEALPVRMQYSSKDDKFRLCCLEWYGGSFSREVLFNMARIRACHISRRETKTALNRPHFPQGLRCEEPVTIAISGERNSLERCMLHFANYEKHTEFDEKRGEYICSIYYDRADETELLVELLSFGPVISILASEPFLAQARERVKRQHELLYGKV